MRMHGCVQQLDAEGDVAVGGWFRVEDEEGDVDLELTILSKCIDSLYYFQP